MSQDSRQVIRLHDDLVLKVSSLLLEDIGSMRKVEIDLGQLPLDPDLIAHDVHASLRLTRLDTGILAQGSVSGVVQMECVRCLREFDQRFEARFAEQFHETAGVLDNRHDHRYVQDDNEQESDELAFEITDAHEIDMTELLRQWIVLALPMTPVCGSDCPGPQLIERQGEVMDDRFAALQQLLENGDL